MAVAEGVRQIAVGLRTHGEGSMVVLVAALRGEVERRYQREYHHRIMCASDAGRKVKVSFFRFLLCCSIYFVCASLDTVLARIDTIF